MQKLLILLSFAGIQLICCIPKLPKADSNEALNAYNDLRNITDILYNRLLSRFQNQLQSEAEKNQEKSNLTLQVVNNKLTDIETKILQIAEKLDNLNNTGCTQFKVSYISEIENSRKLLTNRTRQCTEISYGRIELAFVLIYKELMDLKDAYLNCYKGRLNNCEHYGNTTECYSFVAENIRKAIINVNLDFQLREVNYLSKYFSFDYPCLDLIEFQVTVFPQYHLEAFAICAENSITMQRDNACSI